MYREQGNGSVETSLNLFNGLILISTTKKALFLKADSGFGKTHLFNYVVSHLEKKMSGCAGSESGFPGVLLLWR